MSSPHQYSSRGSARTETGEPATQCGISVSPAPFDVCAWAELPAAAVIKMPCTHAPLPLLSACETYGVSDAQIHTGRPPRSGVLRFGESFAVAFEACGSRRAQYISITSTVAAMLGEVATINLLTYYIGRRKSLFNECVRPTLIWWLRSHRIAY